MKGRCQGCGEFVFIDSPPDGHIVPAHDCGGDERACQYRCPAQDRCGPVETPPEDWEGTNIGNEETEWCKAGYLECNCWVCRETPREFSNLVNSQIDLDPTIAEALTEDWLTLIE